MNKKILIVRGDQQKAKALSFLLAGSGYHISSHNTAGEAVEAARHQRFDLAITDEALPENSPDLGLVSNLKEAQPSLPIFYLSNEQNLETVISCIRAGVTEVIHNPDDFKHLIETTNSYLRASDRQDVSNEVTWEDIVEVERLLDTTLSQNGAASSAAAASGASSAEVEELRAKLDATLKDRDKVSGELASALGNLDKYKRMIEELKNESGNRSTDTEIAERSAELDERETRLRELSAKIATQKVEVETQLAELEAQTIELEEAQKEVKENMDANPAALYSLNKEFEEERAKANEQRLEMQGRILDLERELENSSSSAAGITELEATIEELREHLETAKETISQKDFIIEQRDRELEEAKKPENLAQPLVEELEQEKRLLEIEKHKLTEKLDKLELDKRQLEETHSKQQREIQVERRDAEVSLRELQNQIKEEQLKLKVDQATVKEEMRQFEQARQNFQEDVQELQSKQAELRKFEAYLNDMQKNMKTGEVENALPKPESSALDPLDISSASQPTPERAEIEGSAPSGANEAPKGPDGQPGDPNSWGKPDFEKKKGGRGPLRIGRRSSF